MGISRLSADGEDATISLRLHCHATWNRPLHLSFPCCKRGTMNLVIFESGAQLVCISQQKGMKN